LAAAFAVFLTCFAASQPLWARHYSARVGRFLQQDPRRFRDGDFNLYAYTGNNPVNRIDPYGRSWLSWVFGYGWTGPAADAFDAEIGKAIIKKTDECVEGAKVLYDVRPLEARRMMIDTMSERYALIMVRYGESVMYIVAANDLVGTTNLMEGVYGVDIATETNLNSLERWERGLMGGSQTVTAVMGGAGVVGRARQTFTQSTNATNAAAMRARVLANIAQNRAALNASRIDALIAKEAQLGLNLKCDAFTFGHIKPGKILVRAGSLGRWYTDLETLFKSGFDRFRYFELTQCPSGTVNGVLPNELTMYKVIETIPVAEGEVLANPGLGSGHGWQGFILRHHVQKSLVPVGRVKLQ
jgi:hypothetical protein